VATRDETAALLDLIADRAPGLRAAGVLAIAVDGISAQLAPADQPADDSGQDGQDEEEKGVLDDPATFGRKTGVPGGRSALFGDRPKKKRR